MDENLSDAEVEAIYKLADDVQKLNKRLLNIEESMRVQTASMDEKYDRIIDALEKMMPTPKSESEPLAICFDVMVESVEPASAEIDLASVDVTDKSDSSIATDVFEDGDLCLDVSTINATQAEVTSDLFSADFSLVFAESDAVIGEESFEIKFCVSNCFSDFCLLPVCENASMNWPTHFTMHMDLSDRLKHILPSKQKVRVLKPPAKPPDCRVLNFDGREPFPGNFYFDAKYDIVKCIKTVQQEGLYVHIRFEHYLCEKFAGMMGAEQLSMTWGNSIIMILIENCYTSTQWEMGALGKSQMHWAVTMVVGMDMRNPWILYKQEDLFGGGMVFTHDKSLRLPVKSSFGIFDIHKKMNIIKLYGRRLFVMDNCERLTPKYCGFIKGVVDSEELLLKLFREILQQNKILEVIRSINEHAVVFLAYEFEKESNGAILVFDPGGACRYTATASLKKHCILINGEWKEDVIVSGGTCSAWIMKEVTGCDEEMTLSLPPKRFGNLVVLIDSIAVIEYQGGEDVDDEFADWYVVEGTSLMNPPITVMLVNLIAVAVGVGVSKTIYNVLLQWSKLNVGVSFSFWVLTKFTVYDYMDLGSSPTLLHGNIEASGTLVSGEMRVGIIFGAASGIAYPHMQGSCVYHGHTRSAGILLNKSYELRGHDFGLSQLASSSYAKYLTALASAATSYWICQLTKLHIATGDDASAPQFVYHWPRILDAHIYAYRWTANKEKFQEQFIMFSSPRPPEVADLEDKVNFMGRGMLRNGIIRDIRGVFGILGNFLTI